MVEQQPSKLNMRVRFPLPAPNSDDRFSEFTPAGMLFSFFCVRSYMSLILRDRSADHRRVGRAARWRRPGRTRPKKKALVFFGGNR
jgi:hypothetical protein